MWIFNGKVIVITAIAQCMAVISTSLKCAKSVLIEPPFLYKPSAHGGGTPELRVIIKPLFNIITPKPLSTIINPLSW